MARDVCLLFHKQMRVQAVFLSSLSSLFTPNLSLSPGCPSLIQDVLGPEQDFTWLVDWFQFAQENKLLSPSFHHHLHVLSHEKCHLTTKTATTNIYRCSDSYFTWVRTIDSTSTWWNGDIKDLMSIWWKEAGISCRKLKCVPRDNVMLLENWQCTTCSKGAGRGWRNLIKDQTSLLSTYWNV